MVIRAMETVNVCQASELTNDTDEVYKESVARAMGINGWIWDKYRR